MMNQENEILQILKESKTAQEQYVRDIGAVKEQMKEDHKVLLEYSKMTNEKLDRHDMKLDQHGVRLDRIEAKLTDHDDKLDSIIETVGEVKMEVTGLTHRVEVLERS